jgi:hypothetical protein
MKYNNRVGLMVEEPAEFFKRTGVMCTETELIGLAQYRRRMGWDGAPKKIKAIPVDAKPSGNHGIRRGRYPADESNGGSDNAARILEDAGNA